MREEGLPFKRARTKNDLKGKCLTSKEYFRIIFHRIFPVRFSGSFNMAERKI